MIAKNAISLGIEQKQKGSVRLYAPLSLSFIATHVSLGDITLMSKPTEGYVVCKKLTLLKSNAEDPTHFEIVKSWVVNDDTEIETVQKVIVPAKEMPPEQKEPVQE